MKYKNVALYLGTIIFSTIFAIGVPAYAMYNEAENRSMYSIPIESPVVFEEVNDTSDVGVMKIVAMQEAEAERVAAEKAEEERIAAEQAEAERIAAEQAAYEAQVYTAPQQSYSAPSNGGGLTASSGVNYYNGNRETYYSSDVLYHYRTGEWTLGSDGVYRDADGYVVVASSDLGQGSTVDTSLGEGKVYDSGCASGTVDIYTKW